jgi:hypothetical protein
VTQAAIWSLDERDARLQLGGLAARLDFTRPRLGLHDIRVSGHSIAGASLLAPCFSVQDAGQALALADCFIRGDDLVVTYAQSPARPVRVQIYWRALPLAESAGFIGAIDVQVSVQTSVLEAQPGLALVSRLPTQSIRHVSPSRANDQSPRERATTTSAYAAGYWLCQLPETGVVYGEMVHPADIERELARRIDEQAAELEHHLFARPLEKGVILRARARGVFCSHEAAEAAMASAYAKFLAAPLPLTT